MDYPLKILGYIQAVKEDQEGLMNLGNGVLLNEECVLTSLEPLVERLGGEDQIVAENLMFVYEKNFIFIKKVNKFFNSTEITNYLETLTYKPVFQSLKKSKENRYVILELGTKIANAPLIPRLPPNIMDIFSCKKDNIFEIVIYSLVPEKNLYVETTTLAKMKEDMTIHFEKHEKINDMQFNGSPIFLVMNFSLILIGIYSYVDKYKPHKGKGILLNYTNPAQRSSFPYETRETVTTFMTLETMAETRKSDVNVT